jgi:hypothetical protein
MTTFDNFVETHDLTVLNGDQRDAVLGAIQRHGYADASRIAFSDEFVAVEEGNLEYYAGLEYCADTLEVETRSFTAWELKDMPRDRDDADRNTHRLYWACVEAVAGKDVVF